MVAVAQAPQAMPVVYENLSHRVLEAEGQKDVLFQMLREQWGVAAGFEEALDETGSPSALVVKCLQCGKGGVVYEKGSFERLGGSEVAFRVAENDGRSERWRVAVSEAPVRFVAVAARDFLPGDGIGEGAIQVKACVRESACAAGSAFATRQEALSAVSGWSGMKLARNAREGTVLAPAFFAQEMLVRVNETVRVIVSPSPLVTIRAPGRALASAPKGGRVKIELDSFPNPGGGRGRRVIDAIVTAPGEVSYVR